MNFFVIDIQSDSQTNQRVFEVELQMAGDGKLEGTILMPFGLKLDSGVVLRTAATISESDLLGDAVRRCDSAGDGRGMRGGPLPALA